MRRLVLALTLGIASVASSVTLLAGQQDFVLVNKTGLTISEVYVSSTKTNDWEEDILGRDVLEHDQSVTIRFDRDERQCKFDIKIVDEDGDEVYWTDIDLCRASKVTLKPKGIASIE